ncbi:hypothetical protein BDW72DRAFT_209836 [Aspergillus terricola var. indicus]
MDYLRNLWPLRLSMPLSTPTTPTQQRDVSEEYRKVQWQLECQERELKELHHENRSLKCQSTEARRQHLVDTETIQQQEQLLSQACSDAARREEEYTQQMNQLYSRLNSAQAGPKRVPDEEVKQRLRRLVQNLDSWIKANFKDTDRLASVIDKDIIPSTSPQRRAWIQSYVADLVQHQILSPAIFGVPPHPWGQFIQELEADPESTLQVWRLATARALNDMTAEERKASIARLVDRIEGQFSAGSSSGTEARRQQLQAFVERCALLKNSLTQDPDEFVFSTSQPGAEFSEHTMASINGKGESGGSVRFSLWPALYRRTTGPGCTLVDSELVWTMD